MKIDKDLILKLEKLAQLELGPKEKESLERDLNKILEMVDKMNELNTASVKPLTHISQEVNQLRQDKIDNQISTQEGLSNAPDHDGTYFKVPKVIPKSSK